MQRPQRFGQARCPGGQPQTSMARAPRIPRRMPPCSVGLPPCLSGPPHLASGTSQVQRGAPSSTASRATQFERPMCPSARRAALDAPPTPACDWNDPAFELGAQLTRADVRLAARDTPSILCGSPLQLSGAWMPTSGARPGVAGAQASAVLRPRADGCGRDQRSGPQRVWLGARCLLLGTPSSAASRAKTFGLRATL